MSAPCTQQLWAMLPVGSPWSESMILGARLQSQAQEEYARELQARNAQLASDLSATTMALHAARVCRARKTLFFLFFA